MVVGGREMSGLVFWACLGRVWVALRTCGTPQGSEMEMMVDHTGSLTHLGIRTRTT